MQELGVEVPELVEARLDHVGQVGVGGVGGARLLPGNLLKLKC